MEVLVRQAERFPDLAILPVDGTGLEARDAALAHAIAEQCLRRWLTLRHVLSAYLNQPFDRLEPAMRAVLLAGSAQILLLERIPVHAAIDESVAWAKRRIRPGAAGMVNAVLRRVAGLKGRGTRRDSWTLGADEFPLEDGGVMVLSDRIMPRHAGQCLSVGASVPGGLMGGWVGREGQERAEALVRHCLCRAPILLNVAHGAALGDQRLAPHRAAGHAVWVGKANEIGPWLRDHPGLWVQDPGSAAPVGLTRGLDASRILDLCAGRGTKTRQLRARFPEAAIVATDIDDGRRADLAATFADDSSVRVVEPGDVRAAFPDGADLVLLDVPCTNTGVLARRIEARYRFSRDALQRLVATQREVLAMGVSLLGREGRVLYATCSLEREEGEDQAAWACEEFGLTLEAEERTDPAGTPGEGPDAYRDGAYAAMLRR